MSLRSCASAMCRQLANAAAGRWGGDEGRRGGACEQASWGAGRLGEDGSKGGAATAEHRLRPPPQAPLQRTRELRERRPARLHVERHEAH
jgi:hypothetical protein